MMFKRISMHTKPLKHAKNIEILTNTSNKTRFFENSILMSKVGPNIYALRKPQKMLSDFLDVFYNLQIAQNINITKKCLF